MKKTYKVTFFGGFHNSSSININATAQQLDELNEGFYSLSEILTPNQYKRLNNHFCGVRGCLCGGVIRAKWETA